MKYILFLVGLVCASGLTYDSLGQPTSMYIDGDGYTWEISPTGSNVLQVKNDPLIFNPGLILEISNSNIQFNYTVADFEINGRQYVAGPTVFGNTLEITRKIYVPNDQGWIRVVDRYDNLTPNDIGNFKLNTESKFQGYTTNSTSDNSGTPDWAILTNTDASKPVVALHLNGESSSVDFTLNSTQEPIFNRYDVTSFIDIPANGSVYVMYFASLSNDLLTANDKAISLVDPLPAETLIGLKLNELNGIINWNVSSTCAPPVVSFFANGGCTGESLQFQDNSDLDPQEQSFYTYNWDFGDGTIIEGEINPVHTYANEGSYTVSLTLIENGNEDCIGVSQSVIEVTNPVEIEISDDIVICESEGLVDLKQFISHDGEIIGSFNNLDTYPITEDGILDPALAGPGEFFFEYSLGDLNSCISSEIGSGIIEESGEVGFIDLQPITLFNDADKCEAYYDAATPEITTGCEKGLEVIGNKEPGLLSVGSHIVVWSIIDGEDVLVTENQEINVIDNEVPVVISSSEITVSVDEGSCTFTITEELLEASDNCDIDNISLNIDGVEDNSLVPGKYSVKWTVVDVNNNSTEFDQLITVEVREGEIQDLSVPKAVMTDQTVELSASYSGNTISQALINWGDGNSTEATIEGNKISSSYSYNSPGIYKGEVIILDICGVNNSVSFEIIVDEGEEKEFFGIITGGGWFNSYKGFYPDDPDSEGRSIFGIFVLNSSKRKKAKGSIFFYYTDKKLQFRGRSIESVSVNGDNKIMITANGKLNRKAEATIKIEIPDNGSSILKASKIIVRIYNNELNKLVYDNSIDNGDGSEITGRIGIREEEQKSRNSFAEEERANLVSEPVTWNVYPNPAIDELNILPGNTSFENVRYQIYDLRGQLLIEKQAGFEANYNPTRIDVNNLNPGSYIVNIIDQSGEILGSQRFIKQ